MNYQDKLGVDMVYQAYQKSLQTEINFIDICDSVLEIEEKSNIQKREIKQQEPEEKKEKEKIKGIKSVAEPQIVPEALEEEREEKKELPIKKEYIIIFSVTVCSLFSAFLCYWVYQNGFTKQTFIQCAAMLLIFGSITGFFLLKGKEYLQGTKIIRETQQMPYFPEEEEDISFIKKSMREIVENETENIESMTEDMEEERIKYMSQNLESDTVLLGYIEDNSKCSLIPKGEQEEIIIENFPCTLGKLKEQVDKLIMNETVSRIHARLEEIDGIYYIVDLNSKNGIYVNGIRNKIQERVKIESGDEIKIAALVYEFCESGKQK